MNIRIICVGKVKEAFYRDAIAEYTKRLSAYCKTEIVEVADEKTPENASQAVTGAIKKTEGERILSKMKNDWYTVVLAINGKRYDSVGFAKAIDGLANSGKSNIQFIIGGSLGLSDEVNKEADLLLSFSDMTFPHQLMRVILTEQLYRAFKIIKNEPYHK